MKRRQCTSCLLLQRVMCCDLFLVHLFNLNLCFCSASIALTFAHQSSYAVFIQSVNFWDKVLRCLPNSHFLKCLRLVCKKSTSVAFKTCSLFTFPAHTCCLLIFVPLDTTYGSLTFLACLFHYLIAVRILPRFM